MIPREYTTYHRALSIIQRRVRAIYDTTETCVGQRMGKKGQPAGALALLPVPDASVSAIAYPALATHSLRNGTAVVVRVHMIVILLCVIRQRRDRNVVITSMHVAATNVPHAPSVLLGSGGPNGMTPRLT